MKISAGFVVTEPQKLGYLTYRKCAKSLCSFCDEVVVIFGRDEPESRKSLEQHFGNKIRVHVTNDWPVKYNYDCMRDHFQLIFDLCTGDIVFKIDSDHVFKTEHAKEIRKNILDKSHIHHLVFSGIKFVKKPDYFFYSRKTEGIYGINVSLLKKDGIDFHISNETGSNQPKFSSKVLKTRPLQ